MDYLFYIERISIWFLTFEFDINTFFLPWRLGFFVRDFGIL